MKYLAFAAAVLMTGQAYAADLAATKAPAAPPPAKPLIAWPEPNFDILGSGFDYAYGASFMTDYISRGITQSAHRPSASAYAELHYGWFYGGVRPWAVRLPTEPLAELDVYGGIRPTWGPLTLDFGVVGYLYPGNKTRYFLGGAAPVLTFFTFTGIPTTATDPSYLEIYAKGTWQINDWIAIGSNINYDPNWNNYGARGLYSEVNAKLTIPDTGFSVSGAFGHYYLGYANYLPYGFSFIDVAQVINHRGFKFASYNTWNVGASYNWNMITFDARYYGSTLNGVACAIDTSDPAANFAFGSGGVGRSNWCGSRFMGTISLDFTSATFK
jgi:uncharacterized protein (TIGR02001 family)